MKSVVTRKAWVIDVVHHDLPQSSRLATAPVGEVIALLPSRSSRQAIEGALRALVQFFDGSDAEDMAAYLRLGKCGRDVEWDADEKIAQIGLNPCVRAHKTNVAINVSQRALNAGDGHGTVSAAPLKWTTSRERRDRINSEIAAGTYKWPGADFIEIDD